LSTVFVVSQKNYEKCRIQLLAVVIVHILKHSWKNLITMSSMYVVEFVDWSWWLTKCKLQNKVQIFVDQKVNQTFCNGLL